jgi:hypothetical protein
MRKTALIIAAVLLAAGFSIAQDTEQVKIKGPFQETWVHPDLDIAQYSKLYLWKTVFEFRAGGDTKGAPTTAGKLRGNDGPYFVNEESRLEFEELVTDEFVKELNRSKQFEIVNEVGPDTLLVRALLLDIVSNVPPKYTGTADVYLSAIGEATFVFELIDAETGEVQATVGERRRIQPPSRFYDVSSAPATSATIMNDVKVWAQSVARDLRVALDKAKKKAS